VPEFGALSIVILAIAIVSVMIMGQKSRFRLNL
jgi:predicted secreted protein with PEFG-CTERM motif